MLAGGLERRDTNRNANLSAAGRSIVEADPLNITLAHVSGSRRPTSALPEKIATSVRQAMHMFSGLSEDAKLVAVFGSARQAAADPYQEIIRGTAAKICSSESFDGHIVTGAGSGAMEYANDGAFSISPRKSWGVKIELPFETVINQYIGAEQCLTMEKFAPRKVGLVLPTDGVAAVPGGFGTLDEVLEVLSLTLTHGARQVPIVLVVSGFWQPIIEGTCDFFRAQGAQDSLIGNVFRNTGIVDTPDETVEFLRSRMSNTPRSRAIDELMISRFTAELTEGYRVLHAIEREHRCVAIHGGWDHTSISNRYIFAEEMAKMLGREGMAILLPTPTTMNVSVAMTYAHERFRAPVVTMSRHRSASNPHVFSAGSQPVDVYLPGGTSNIYIPCKHEFTAEILGNQFALADIYFPGGPSVLANLMENLTLMQTGKIPAKPIILVGRIWEDLLSRYKDILNAAKTISEKDFRFVAIVDTPAEAMSLLRSRLV